MPVANSAQVPHSRAHRVAMSDPGAKLRGMGIEATGKLHIIFDTKQVSEKFTKREFVVEMSDNPKYPQMVLFQLTGDRCSQLDQVQVGDQVRIDFSLRGREWKSPSGEVKYFNSLDCWKVEPMRANASNGRRSNGPDAYDRDAPPREYDARPSDETRNLDDIPF